MIHDDRSVVPKNFAQDNQLNEVAQAFARLFHLTGDGIDGGAIAAVQFAADGIGEQFPGETAGEGFVLRDNQLPELGV